MDGAQARIFTKSASGGQSGAGEASRSSLQNSKNSALNSTSSASSAAQRSSNFEASSSSSNVNANGNRSENVSVKKQQLSSTSGTTTKGTSSPAVNSSTANSQQQTSKGTNSSSNVVHNSSSNNLSSSNSNGAQSVTAPNKRPNQSSSGNNNNGSSNTNSSNAGSVNTSSNNSNSRNYNTGGEYGSNTTRSGGAGTGRVINNRSNEYGETGNYNSGTRPSNKQRERDDTSGYSAGGGGYGNENAAKNDSYYYRENSRRPGGSTATTGSAAAARGKPSAQQLQPASKQRQQYQEYYEDEGYEYDETDYNSRQNYGAGSRGGTGARRPVGGQTARAGADYNEKEPVRRGAGQSDRRGGDGTSVPARDDRTARTGGTRREQQPTTQRSDKSGKDDEKGWDEDQEAGQWDTAATGGRGAKSGAAASARAHHTAASQQPSSGSPSVNSVSATGTPATGSGGELVNDDLPSSTLNGSSSAAGGGRAPSREQQNAALSAPAGESTWPSVSEWNSPSAANVTSSSKEEQDFGGVWDANEKAANKFSAVAVNSTTAGMKPKDPYGDIMLSGAVGHRSGSNPSAANLNDNSGNDFNSDLRSGSTGGVSTNRRSVPPLGVGANEADYLGTSRWGNPTSSSNTNQPVSSTPSSGTQNNNRQGGVNSGGSFVGMWTNSTVAGGGAPGGAQNHIPNWENLTKFTKQDSGSTDTGRGSVSASTKPTIPDNPNSPASLGNNNSMFGNMPGGNAGGPQPLIASMQQQIDFNFMQQISKIQAAAAAAAIAPGSLPLPRPEIGGVPGLHNTNRPHMMSQIATSNIGSMQSPAASFVNSFTFPGGSNSIGGGGGGLAGIGGSGPLPVPGGAARWQPPAGGPFGASNATMGVSPASNQALEMFSQLNAETAKLAAAAAAAGNLHQQQQQQQQSGINAALLGMQSHLAQHPGASSQQQQQSQMLPPHLQQQGGQHQQHGPLGNLGQPQPPFGQQMFLNQFHHQQVQQQQHAEQQQKMLLQQQQQQQANEEMRKQQQELLQQQRQREDNDRRAAAEAAASAVAAAAAQAAAETAAAEKRRQQEAEEAELNRADDEYEAELRSLNWDEQFRALGGANASSNDYSACKKRVNELHEKFQSTLRNMAAAPSRDELTNLIAITRFMLEAGEQCFLRDSVRSYAEGLHDVVWKHGLHALLSFMRREHDVVGGGADSQQSSKSQRVHGRRGLTVAISVVLDFGIYFLQQLVSRVLGLFGGRVDALSLQLASNLTNSQEKVLKLAAYLDIALGDLYRYKGSLLSVGANAKSVGEGKGGESQQRQLVRLEMRHAFKHARYCYEDAYNLCAIDGYAQNQLALVSRLERCYLDMVYHCVRALSVPKQPFLLAQQMLNDTLREIGNTYENSLDKKLSPGSIGQLDLPTLMRECNLLFLYFHSLIGSNNKNSNEMHASTTQTTTPNSNKQPSTVIRLGSATGTKQSAESAERQQQQYQQIIFDFLTRWKAVLAHGICEPVRSIFLKMNVINMYVLSNAMGNPAVFPPVIDLCLHMFAALVERLLDVLNEASSSTSSAAAASVSLPSGSNATLSGSSGSSTVGAASSGNTVEHQLEAIIMDEQVALLMSCCKAFCDWLVTHIAAWNPLPATPFLQSAEWTYERMLTLLAELCTVSRQINLQGVNELVPYRTERVVPFQLIEDTFARNMSSIREAHVIFHNEPSLTREVAEMRARMSRFMLLGNMFATMQNPVFEFDVQTLDLRPVPKYIDKSLEGKYRRLRLVQPSPSLHLSVALQAAAAAQATAAATGGAVQPPAAVTPNPAVMNFFNNVLPAPPPQAALSAMTPQQQHDLFASSPAAAAMYAPAHGVNAAANAIPFGAPRWNAHRTMSNTGRTPQGLMAPAMHAPPPPPPASAKVEDWPDLMDADIVATSQYPTSATVGGGRRKGDSESSAGAGGVYRGMYSNGVQQQQNIPSPSSTPGVAGGSMDFENLPATTPPVTSSATSGSTTSASTTAANKDVKSSIAQPWWLIDKNMRREAMRMEGGVKRDNMLSTRTDSSKSSGDADHSDQAANSASAANNQRKYLFVDTNALLKGGGDCVKKLMTEESRMAVMVPSVVVRELTNHTKDLSRSHEEQSDAHAALDFIFELSTKRDSRVKIVSIGGLLLKDSQAAMKENAWERGSNDDLILKCVKNAVEKGFIATELKNASTVPLSGASATSSGPARPPLVAFLTEDVNLRTKARRELIEARSLQDVSDAKFKWV